MRVSALPPVNHAHSRFGADGAGETGGRDAGNGGGTLAAGSGVTGSSVPSGVRTKRGDSGASDAIDHHRRLGQQMKK